MTPPYEAHTMDSLLLACIEFDDQHHEDFYAGEIAGRGSVPPDSAEVKTMLERVSRWDGDLLENLGIALDNLTYFRLGVAARRVMRSGGVGALLRKQRLTRLRKVWVPIVLTILALAVSILGWLFPREATHKKEDEIKAQLARLEQAHSQLNHEVLAMRKSLDSLKSHPSR